MIVIAVNNSLLYHENWVILLFIYRTVYSWSYYLSLLAFNKGVVCLVQYKQYKFGVQYYF